MFRPLIVQTLYAGRHSKRFFARGIYREQMLEKQKINRIKFRTEPIENMQVTSKEEQ